MSAFGGVPIGNKNANDVATVTGATIASTRAANWDKALARGIPVIAVLIPPRYSGADAGGYTAAKQGALTGANLEIVRLARARKGVYILDAFSILSTAAGISKTGYTIDGIHQSGGMGYYLGTPQWERQNSTIRHRVSVLRQSFHISSTEILPSLHFSHLSHR